MQYAPRRASAPQAGDTRMPTAISTGTASTSQRFQDQIKYKPAAAVAIHMLRVKAASSDAAISAPHAKPHPPERRAAGEKNRNAVTSKSAIIIWPLRSSSGS